MSGLRRSRHTALCVCNRRCSVLCSHEKQHQHDVAFVALQVAKLAAQVPELCVTVDGLALSLAAEQAARSAAQKELSETQATLAARDAEVADLLRACAAASAEAQAYVEQVRSLAPLSRWFHSIQQLLMRLLPTPVTTAPP